MNRRSFCPGLPGKLLLTATTILVPGLVAGCLDRPIGCIAPRNTATVVEVLQQNSVDKIDLLLAIDNSNSMADKQQILAQAVPDLVEALINPRCIDLNGAPIAQNLQPKTPGEDCPNGSFREFEAIKDIHIGIISSSLGGHGGSWCPDQEEEAECGGAINTSNNDHGRLLSREDVCDATKVVPTYAGKGFLAWDPDQKLMPAGETQIGKLDGSEPGIIPTLADMVQGVGQRGCGYESQLESIYRFLVDPEPYGAIVASGGSVKVSDSDDTLLKQRADFLRPDSLVAVLMLTDENDCSIKEYSYFYKASDGPRLPKARAICATDPNNACCSSCGLPVPKGCEADPTCFDDKGNVAFLSITDDSSNMRCFDQKKRFGIDFLYPTDRYVKAFSSETIAKRNGEIVDNPLFVQGGGKTRPKDLVLLAGIVGVPWQDIARDPKDLTKGLKTATEMAADGTWNIILGDPATNTLPTDPLMHESMDPRDGIQPITQEPIDTTPDSPLGNSINGHEYDTQGSDLQYACIFDLPMATDCTTSTCGECPSPDNPLCDVANPNLQARAKAYPGLRQLEVLRGLDKQGIVGSVCPRQVTDRTSPDYGYRPAIGALVDQLKSRLAGPCLPRYLNPDTEGQVNCLLLEARDSGGACSCDEAHARRPVLFEHEGAIDEAKKTFPNASWDCFCEIPQLVKDDLAVCQNDISPEPKNASGEAVSGFCYVDAMQDPAIGNPALVARCAETERRKVRFIGEGEPAKGATLFVSCSVESTTENTCE